jgi:spore coat protein CotF
VISLNLTQKETDLLTDLKKAEQLCIEKYQRYANEACDPELKSLFTSLAGTEKQHMNTITQIMSGTVPSMQAGQGQQQQQNQMPAQQKPAYGMGNTDQNKTQDSFLCSDQLSTEKHVSSMYDTCIFEFKDPNIRNALNHIQKEEQQHGEKIYSYMAKNSMYS